jgi:hypothetical protein
MTMHLPTLLTTAQQLGSIIKSARDIMRKDKGLNGDLDRLPMLTWIMFLKFLDDMEQIREQEATLAGKKFRPALEPPYRWRDWAAKPDGITGPELISFVIMMKPFALTENAGLAYSPISVRCKAQTAATDVTWLPRCSRAS